MPTPPRTDRPVLVVTGRHRPHEVLLLVSFLAFGIVYLAGAPASPAMANSPHWLFLAWAGGLLAGGAVGLVGCFGFRRNVTRGLRLETGGMLLSAGSLILYAAAAFAVAGTQSLVGAGFGLTIAAANLWRVWQTQLDLHEIKRSM